MMADLQYGGIVRFNENSRWTYRLDYTHATVKASDEQIKWRPERGLNFLSKINDVSLVVEFNFPSNVREVEGVDSSSPV